MSWMTISAARRLVFVFVLIFSLSACESSSSSKVESTGGPSPLRPTPVSPPVKEQYPQLSNSQKTEALDFFLNINSIQTVTNKLYDPKHEGSLDSVETIVYDILNRDCVADNSSQEGDKTSTYHHALTGDSCPAKASSDTQITDEGNSKKSSTSVINIELLTDEVQRPLQLLSLHSESGSSAALSLRNNLITQILSSAGSEVVELYDHRKVSTTTEMKNIQSVYTAVDLGEGYWGTGDLVSIQGKQVYVMKFPDFTATLEILFSAKDGREHGEFYLNGEHLTSGITALPAMLQQTLQPQ